MGEDLKYVELPEQVPWEPKYRRTGFYSLMALLACMGVSMYKLRDGTQLKVDIKNPCLVCGKPSPKNKEFCSAEHFRQYKEQLKGK